MTETSSEKKHEAKKPGVLQNPWVKTGGLIAAVAIVAAGFLYFQSSSTRVKIDTSMVSAPQIDLSPSAPGQLMQTYVNVGDSILANTPVAEVGTEILTSKTAGLVVAVHKDTGKSFNPGQPVVSMIDPNELRVVGTIDENKGLDKIKVGQLANFTVDAFGSKTYQGVVDEVSPSANSTGALFNISDQRPTQQFDVKVRFDASRYPELKNGMSAKLTIFIK